MSVAVRLSGGGNPVLTSPAAAQVLDDGRVRAWR
jgi:hypothetical protein